MQSGHSKSNKWIVECLPLTAKKPEDLMGWVSAGDTEDQVKIVFSSRDSAIAFAEKQGWKYSVIEAHERKVHPRSYADNFVCQLTE